MVIRPASGSTMAAYRQGQMGKTSAQLSQVPSRDGHQAKPNQQNTPIDKNISRPEQVTITDPHHPLYDCTFPLHHIKNKRGLIMSCVIELMPDVMRLIPLAATNLSMEERQRFPLQINVVGLQELVTTYAQIAGQVAKEHNDASASETSRRSDPEPTALDKVNTRAATAGEPNVGSDLSATDRTTGARK